MCNMKESLTGEFTFIIEMCDEACCKVSVFIQIVSLYFISKLAKVYIHPSSTIYLLFLGKEKDISCNICQIDEGYG